MTFTYDQATKIVENYKHLKGQFLDIQKSLRIANIYIFPSNKDIQNQFFLDHKFFTDNLSHLIKFGADLNIVEVYVYYWNEPALVKVEIDDYLTKHNLDKKYD
ncbi:MAG: hypothetical protein KG003_14305 [Bacteroidetes bacterium]|nr:hypothetical protein [Bacteroidota bacterium]